MARFVTFGDDSRPGRIEGDEIRVLDVPDLRTYFERGEADETGESVPLEGQRLRPPIVPKKFFHTAGNFREHEEESKNVNWSHQIAPWINFFQNVDAIVGPEQPVVYPEHRLGAAIGLPTFEFEGATLYRRVTLVFEAGRIAKV